MKNDTFIAQEINKLGEHGYVELAADSDFFDPFFAALKTAHPNAAYVEDVGSHALAQIIYLPKAKRTLVARLKRERDDYAKALRCTEKAIAALR